MTIMHFSGYLAVVNLAAVLVFALDKTRARTERRRIPETWLLALAFLGGWPGAKFAQSFFRHKTTKQPFRLLLDLVPVAWIGMAFAITAIAVFPSLSFAKDDNLPKRSTPKFFESVSKR